MSATPTLTHCPYCSLQCGITLTAGDRPAVLQPQQDFPTNRGGLCSKGWTAATLLDHPQRLMTPLVRRIPGDRSSDLVPASWDEALTRVVAGFESAQQAYGRDAVGCFGGGGLTNEKAYAFGKFARVALRTAMIDYNGRFCMSSAATASNRAFGIDRGLPFPLADIAETKAILLVGSNPAATMPPAMQYFDAGRAAGATHIVVDPRNTATAQGSTMHLAPLPGTDLALANGLLHLAIKNDLIDVDYISQRTKGFAAVKASVAGYWPDRVERITGVSVASMRRTVEVLATAPSAMIMTARGAEQHSSGTDMAQAYINLALALGLPGRPFSGYGTITGQGNGQGGREHGQKADQLPGYRKLADPADRAYVAGVWGIDPEELPRPGLSAFEMLDRMGSDGGVRALWVVASNLVVSAPDVNRVIDRLRALDLLVVSDIFMSETAAMADVVLPAAQWAEEEGTMTNLEGRVLRRKQALPPPGEVRDDLWVMKELAERLGRGQYFSADPRTVFTELRRASAGGLADYSGISYERIDAEQGVFWPCPQTPDGAENHPGTPRLFADGFPTADGRACFIRVEYRQPDETPSADFPYVLTTGRLMAQYQSGTQTRRVPAPSQSQVQPEAQLHSDLARRLEIESSDIVQLTSPRGAATFRARVNDDILPGVVFVPFHWGGASAANALTNPALDRYSKMPAFKVCAVQVARIGAPDDNHLLTSPPQHDRLSAPTRPTLNQLLQPSRRKDLPMITQNRFLQGIYPFTGAGLDKPTPISPELSLVVPDGVISQALYFRGGNTTDELIIIVLMRDGVPMRYFPIGAKSDVHVPLRVVEDIEGGSVVELQLVAPLDLEGSVVVDLGLVEH